MNNEKNKSYPEFITSAAKEIKKKAPKDLKRVKEELNKPLSTNIKDKNKKVTLKSNDSSEEDPFNFKEENIKTDDDDKSSSLALDKKINKKLSCY